MFHRDWRGDALSKIRWQAVRALAPRRTVRSRGLQFTLSCDNWITQYRWASYNTKEPDTLDWIDRWVRDGDVVFDVGANIGVYAIYMALRHPRARVIAFEPEYANLHLLRDNIFANGLQDRIEVYAMALSNRSGLSHLHIQDATPGAALHSESPRPLQATLTNRPVIWREGIYSVTLDHWCRERAVGPNAIKIDVDGTECAVLEGAAGTLRSPALRSCIIEWPDGAPARDTCARLLAGAGFDRAEDGSPARRANAVWTRRGTR